MRREEPVLAPVDLGLLDLLAREPSLVAACRRLGIRRDRGVYRLQRIARLTGRPAVDSERGGTSRGATRLTAFGRALLAEGVGAPLTARPTASRRPPINTFRGVWHARPHPSVAVPGGPTWLVDFLAREGERVTVMLEPEAVLVAKAVFATSARNVLSGRVRRVLARGAGTGGERRLIEVGVGSTRVVAAVTLGSVERLGLARGALAVLYVKATALRRGDPGRPRAPTRGSRRS